MVDFGLDTSKIEMTSRSAKVADFLEGSNASSHFYHGMVDNEVLGKKTNYPKEMGTKQRAMDRAYSKK